MHDLMHDIAQEVAGDEICGAHSAISKINGKTRHIFHVQHDCGQSSLPPTKIRTCLIQRMLQSPPMDDIVTQWKYLRALHLQSSLPRAIGRLLHLRYLDLSAHKSLERLPEEITKLYNLQTLLLTNCSNLKRLPRDLSKLAKLRVLDIEGCYELRYMPCGLDKLTGLCILPMFVVGEVKSSKQKQGVGRLEDIAGLDELKGKLIIKICSNAKYVKGNDKGEFLKRKEHINEIDLQWSLDEDDENKVVSDKAILEVLQPNPNLKRLGMSGYKGVDKPSWAIDDKLQTSLPNLVKLFFYDCKGLEDLPMLGSLRFLKALIIASLVNLEYLEKGSNSSCGGDEAITGTGLGLFPSLEDLTLWDLPKLKGWWRGDEHMGDDDDDRSQMSISFPHLCVLSINSCSLLTSMPLCPTIEKMGLFNFNERLKIMKIKGVGGVEDGDVDTPQPKLSEVSVDDLGYLMKSLPIPAAFRSLSKLYIGGDNKVENLKEVEEVFRSCSSSLQSLTLFECRKVRSISGALEHLTALQSLDLCIHDDIMNNKLMRSRLEEDDEVPWSALQHSLPLLQK